MCYNGFGRGALAEILNLVGAVTVSSLTINYAGTVTKWVLPYMRFSPATADCLVFWALFVIGMFGLRLLLRRMLGLIKWERLHWTIQGIGLIVGGLRGLWWSGLILVALATSGLTYFQESTQKSVLGPRLLEMSRRNITQVADRFPGSFLRGETLIPPVYVKPKPK